MVFNVKVKNSYNILRAVWCTLTEWVDNYNASGIVQGISMDM